MRGMLLGACAAVAAAAGTDHNIDFTTSGGDKRTAILHLPPFTPHGSLSEVAMIVNLHTLAESAKAEEKLTHMNTLADSEGFIVVYPDGLLDGNVEPFFPLGVGKSWNGGTCCPKACSEGTDDVAFVTELVPFVKDAVINMSGGALKIDSKRVYGTGGSNGAFMMNRIGCQAPDLFAAIAPVAGPIANGHAIAWPASPYACPTPERPLPTLYFHGHTDPLVPFGGNPLLGFPPIMDYIQQRTTLNGITSGSANGTVGYRKGKVICTTYGEKANNVTFCEHPSGHCWPGSLAQGPCTLDIDATNEMWTFFQRYRLP